MLHPERLKACVRLPRVFQHIESSHPDQVCENIALSALMDLSQLCRNRKAPGVTEQSAIESAHLRFLPSVWFRQFPKRWVEHLRP